MAMLLKITLLSLTDWDWKGLFKGKQVALKSAVACCLTYLLATGTFAGTLQCPRNAFHLDPCLNWFGFWGFKDLWKSSGRASEKTEKPMWSGRYSGWYPGHFMGENKSRWAVPKRLPIPQGRKESLMQPQCQLSHFFGSRSKITWSICSLF